MNGRLSIGRGSRVEGRETWRGGVIVVFACLLALGASARSYVAPPSRGLRTVSWTAPSTNAEALDPTAPGNIMGINIAANGRVAEVHLWGMQTNALAFNGGWGSSNKVNGTERFVLTRTVPSFDDAGAATTISETIYGTVLYYLQYPSNSLADASNVTTNLIARLSLSDYVFAGDTALSVVVSNGAFSDSIRSNLTATVTATNNSIRTYADVAPIHRWAQRQWDMTTSNTFPVQAVAFQRSARDGRPVKWVRFWAQDTNGAFTATQTVTSCTILSSLASDGDDKPVQGYTATLDVSGLAQGGWFTNFYEVGSWVHTNIYRGRPWVAWNNRTAAFKSAWAYVDATNGVDASGIAYTNAPGGTTNFFLTLGAALVACRGTNNIMNGHNTVSGSSLFLEPGTYPTLGAGSFTHTPVTWCWIEANNPALEGSIFVTNSASNPSWNGAKLGFRNVTVNAAGTGWINANELAYHAFDSLTLDAAGTSTAIIAFAGESYFTRCRVKRVGNQGLRPYTSQTNHYHLRGLNCADLQYGVEIYNVLGCSRSNVVHQQAANVTAVGSAVVPAPDFVWAFNYWAGSSNNNAELVFDAIPTNMVGGVIAGSVFEQVSTNQSPSIVDWASSTAANGTNRNWMVWNNTIVGGKATTEYCITNTAGTPFPVRELHSRVNTYFDMGATKSDHNFAPFDGQATNNWSRVFSVGDSGNVNAHTLGIGAPGSFQRRWAGVSSFEGWQSPPAITFPAFVDRKSYAADATLGTGNGDYRLQSTSPLRGMAWRLVLPYDLAGVARSAGGACGAYEYVP